jgi:SAM-dependent methyltransferase
MTLHFPGTTGYGAQATSLADQYESITFEEVHREILHLVPERACRVLDIGAGSGRDAAALAARGHRVVAVEPTDELRSEGQRRHGGNRITWIADGLPTLATVRERGETYDLVLLTAVWMHLDETERRAAMATLADLVACHGVVAMTLRHGPQPAGRRMFDVSTRETIALAASAGLICCHRSERDDMLGRDGVNWSVLGFSRPA